MKITISIIIISVLCTQGMNMEDLKDLSSLELLKLGQDILQPMKISQIGEEVFFYMVTKNIRKPLLLTHSAKNLLNGAKTTKILIHGWLENHKRSWYKEIAEKCLKNNDFNIVEVDWERPARMAYVNSAKITKDVGYIVAQFLLNLNVQPQNMHFIGHSLGAHVAGFAGKKILTDSGRKVYRITGLDPAGPYFRRNSITSQDRLHKNDADIVDAIHTDAGFYGYEDPIGTLDIYVNGGERIQPGCLDELRMSPSSIGDILEKSFCSHAKSVEYFTEWIDKGTFQCRFCRSVFATVTHTRCSILHQTTILGSEDVNVSTVGVCFAATNNKQPYLQHMN